MTRWRISNGQSKRAKLNLLLDTHILIWWLADDPRLSNRAREAIEKCDSAWVSAVSAWEIEEKRSRRLLDAPDDLEEVLPRYALNTLTLTLHHATVAGRLPRNHGDPFDRMLVAQAQVEGLTVLTVDKRMAEYGVPVLLV